MRLLIDGYNLLHATDLFGSGSLEGTLRGSREALVAFLARGLTERERRATVVVFDAADAPPGLPDTVVVEEMTLRFARGYPDADTLIEETLETVGNPRAITVVSGDRRVQRAARSRGARYVDSDTWYRETRDRASSRPPEERRPKPAVGSNAEWVAQFSDPEALARIEREAAETPLPQAALPPSVSSETPPHAEPSNEDRDASKRPDSSDRPKRRRRGVRRPPLGESDKPKGAFGEGLGNPFPPGYGEDLLE